MNNKYTDINTIRSNSKNSKLNTNKTNLYFNNDINSNNTLKSVNNVNNNSKSLKCILSAPTLNNNIVNQEAEEKSVKAVEINSSNLISSYQSNFFISLEEEDYLASLSPIKSNDVIEVFDQNGAIQLARVIRVEHEDEVNTVNNELSKLNSFSQSLAENHEENCSKLEKIAKSYLQIFCWSIKKNISLF